MQKHIGKQTIQFQYPPTILATGSIVGPKEGEGPLGKYFDTILEDELWGENTWEKAESKFVREAINTAIKNASLTSEDINYIYSGDLLNQLSASVYGIRDLKIPFFGIYGACSTMSLSLSLSAMTIDGGFADYVVACTSSHFCSAEKQFRSPLELGSQRPKTSTWTVTGSGAAVVAKEGQGPYITYITTGKMIDFNMNDPMNMGAVMAPAAADTIINHFIDTGRNPDYYDLIITGDLGKIGKKLTCDLVKEFGYDIESIYSDCGIEIFDGETQGTDCGGSGCGCSAVTFAGYLYKELQQGKFNKILLVSTGALLSPVSIQQGETIPGIAHAVAIEKTLG